MSQAMDLLSERRHYDALTKLPAHQWGIRYLYDRLNVVDSKTSALMRVNGVMMGFVSVAVFRVSDRTKGELVPYPGVFLVLCTLIFVFMLIAGWYSFGIFRLRFDRLNGEGDIERYTQAFFDVTLSRERQFRKMRNWSFAGAFLFSALFAFTTAYKALEISFPTVNFKGYIDQFFAWFPSMLCL